MAAKPASASGVIAASAPPASTRAASPRRMIQKASPNACAPLAQAVAIARLGPRAPKWMATLAGSELGRQRGSASGEIRRAPRWRRRSALAMKPAVSPAPAPRTTPISAVSGLSGRSRASSSAMRAAAIASCEARS